jgi:hypothetical protein
VETTGVSNVTFPAVKVLLPFDPVVALKKPKVTPATNVPTAATVAIAPAPRAIRFLMDIFIVLFLLVYVIVCLELEAQLLVLQMGTSD